MQTRINDRKLIFILAFIEIISNSYAYLLPLNSNVGTILSLQYINDYVCNLYAAYSVNCTAAAHMTANKLFSWTQSFTLCFTDTHQTMQTFLVFHIHCFHIHITKGKGLNWTSFNLVLDVFEEPAQKLWQTAQIWSGPFGLHLRHCVFCRI